MKRLVCLIVILAANAVFCGEVKVLFQDDFEKTTALTPPPGWSMWGAEQYKNPAHYTFDSANARHGRASFRIYHPANTGGYISLSPARAIEPHAATCITVTFWARVEHPGKALLRWGGYRTLKPFMEAPSPGSFSFAAGREWKEFTFTVREGLDLFVDQCRFLLLSFSATTSSKEEQTLWIDDVRVTEQPDPQPVRLINDETVAHAALSHRLQAGDRLEFTVDPTNRLRRATQTVGGVSFHRVCGWTGQPYNKQGDYTLAPQLETAIRDMHLPVTRFYAVGDEPFGVEKAIDKVAEMCRRVGVTEENCVVEFEPQGANARLLPEVWARGVANSLLRGYRFHRWEIANEPYSSQWGEGRAFPTADVFIEHFRAVAQAIRAVDPRAQLGVDIHPTNVKWGNYLLRQLAGEYDFVAPHYYCGANLHQLSFEEIALTENYRMLDRALRIQALMRAYNPGRNVYQFDTEWGMICRTPDGKEADDEPRNANIIGTLHRAVRLIYYAREDILRGASSWQMLNKLNAPGFGILAQEAPEKRFMLYWLYYYFNRHLGEWALATDGTAPFYQPELAADRAQFTGPLTPTLATLSKDGRELYLVIANASWAQAVPCRVHLQNFAAGRAGGVLLTGSSLDASPLLERKEEAVRNFPVVRVGDDLTCTIPAHSVVFVTLEQLK
ncbi:MAG: hypothetical protein WCH99_07370 [Verrucomicrobiota bacterium]